MPEPEATVALVTGASRGIGHATALAMARDGLRVAIGYRSDPEGAEEVVAKATTEGVRAISVELDVRDEASVDRAFAAIEDDLGPVRVLVNNAGYTKDGLAVRYQTSNWESTIGVNLTGAFFCIRRALPAMLKSRWGRIVNVASAAALRGNAGQAAYSASKAGLIGMTEVSRPRGGQPGHHGQRGLSRIRRHAHDRGAGRGDPPSATSR